MSFIRNIVCFFPVALLSLQAAAAKQHQGKFRITVQTCNWPSGIFPVHFEMNGKRVALGFTAGYRFTTSEDLNWGGQEISGYFLETRQAGGDRLREHQILFRYPG